MKGPFSVDNPIISKLDGHKMSAILFCKINIGVEDKDPSRRYV
jgi:hypothetical protein